MAHDRRRPGPLGASAEGGRTIHDAAYLFVRRLAATLRDRRAVLEIGSRQVNGTVRDCFPLARRYAGVDLLPGEGVEVVADVTEWQTDERFDTVVCCEVLEHAIAPAEVCRRALELLEPGGVFLVTAAGPGRLPHSGVDGGPLKDGEHYRNVTTMDLHEWLAGFGLRFVDEVGEDVRALAVK